MRLFLGFLFLLPLAVAAQPDERLPDLTPRAFEIRGDLQISLPNLERQPLRGFAPPPRTYVVPADRRTFIAPYGQSLTDLPADPLAAPEPPQVSALSPLTGRIDIGFGRYLSRLGRVTVNAGNLGVDVGYSGFSNFQAVLADDAPDLDEDFDAMSDVFDGRVAYTSQGPTRVGFEASGDYQRYSLIDAVPNDRPNRTSRTVGGAVSLASEASSVAYDLGLGFASTDVSIDLDFDLVDLNGIEPGAFDQTETRLDAHGGARTERFRLDAGGALGGLGDEGLGESLTSYHAGGAVRLDVGQGELEVGARVLGYSASELNGGGSSTSVGPVVRFETPVSDAALLFVRAEPTLEGGALADLFRENPFAVPEPFLAPNLHVLDGTGGLEIQSRSVRFTVYGGGRWSPVYRYYERSQTNPFAGLYDARYGDARVFRAGGTVTFYAPSGFRVTLGAEGRSGTLSEEDRDIPYFAPLTGSVSVGLPFAGSRGLVQVTGTAESSRPTEDPETDADGWATLDAEATYLFATGFGVLVRAERLAGRAEQWPGYPRPPATVLAGLRVRW